MKEGIIKLPTDHPMQAKGAVRPKTYCGYHDTTTHNLSECRAFKQEVQKAIQSGQLVFGSKKMGVETNPFPMNMADGFFPKGKVQVLTSDKAKETGAVDPRKQITPREYKDKVQFQNSRTERGESLGIKVDSLAVSKPRVTSRILLNKWQRQQEKEKYQQYREREHQYHYEQERLAREQEASHWNCAFFRHCRNEGLKLPTLNNCPECSDQYRGYRQAQTNRRSVHDRLRDRFYEVDRRLKINLDRRNGKRVVDQDWVDYENFKEEEREYVWQKGQWCPLGLRKSQKRHVQRLRNKELQ